MRLSRDVVARVGPGRILALEGPSGAGKTSVARALAATVPGAIRIPEAFDRMRPRPSLAVRDRSGLRALERRFLAAERLRWRWAERLRAQRRIVVLDTGTLGPLTYAIGLGVQTPRLALGPEAIRRLGAPRGATAFGLADRTLYLLTPPRTRARRTRADPTGHPGRWRLRHAEVGRVEETLWTGALGPLLGPRFAVVSGRGTLPGVVARAVTELDRARRQPPLDREAGRALALRLVGALARSAGTLMKGTRAGGDPRR